METAIRCAIRFRGSRCSCGRGRATAGGAVPTWRRLRRRSTVTSACCTCAHRGRRGGGWQLCLRESAVNGVAGTEPEAVDAAEPGLTEPEELVGEGRRPVVFRIGVAKQVPLLVLEPAIRADLVGERDRLLPGGGVP